MASKSSFKLRCVGPAPTDGKKWDWPVRTTVTPPPEDPEEARLAKHIQKKLAEKELVEREQAEHRALFAVRAPPAKFTLGTIRSTEPVASDAKRASDQPAKQAKRVKIVEPVGVVVPERVIVPEQTRWTSLDFAVAAVEDGRDRDVERELVFAPQPLELPHQSQKKKICRHVGVYVAELPQFVNVFNTSFRLAVKNTVTELASFKKLVKLETKYGGAEDGKLAGMRLLAYAYARIKPQVA